MEEYLKRRKFLRKWGWIALIFALVNALPFPLPIPGVFAYYISLVLFIFSIVALLKSYQLPSVRIIGLVSEKTNGYITASILIYYLDISTLTAENIISKLFLNGYLKIVNKIHDETPIAQWLCSYVGSLSARSEDSKTDDKETVMPLTPDINLSEHTANNPDISVNDINQMIFSNSMNVGSSGQPV